MAERFNLTAQLQLQAPSNTAQVVGQIRKQLKGVAVDVKVKANPRQVAEVNKQLQNVNKSAAASAQSIGGLNQNLAAAARRFSVITVATGAFLSLARAVKNSTKEAIAFERELLKISQVTGKSVSQLSGLVSEVTKLSRSLGTSSSDLLAVSRTLAQAGFSAQKTKQALESLAQTTLAATFNNIEDTTEAAIAVLRQFSAEARRSGGEIQFLQSTLDAINSVSKNFAVEAGDLTTVIRRVGGVFSSAGGSVNELIALFTSVRSTTRESAETIATGLRTIFTRIQRTDTVDQLAALGIQLRDSQGQFVGAYEAVRRLSAGLSALDPRDFRFSEIVESLGGFRQVGKVIPLIQQFAVAQDALNVAQGSAGSVARDAATAQKGLGNQIAQVREDFQALMRQFADSSTFRAVAGGALELAKAFIKIASSLEDMLPLIATLISMKIGQSLAPGLGAVLGFGGARRKNQGGKIHAFARGGFVPGTGNRDTVPAMLQPGEFVIKKSSAEKLGASTLEAMNNNRFAPGGTVRQEVDKLRKTKAFTGSSTNLKKDNKLIGTLTAQAGLSADLDTYQAAFLRPEARDKIFKGVNTPSEIKNALKANPAFRAIGQLGKTPADKDAKKAADDIINKYAAKNKYQVAGGSLEASASEALEDTLYSGVVTTLRSASKNINRSLGIQGAGNIAQALKSANIDQTIGNLFEASLSFAGAPFGAPDTDPANAPFDFPQGLGGSVASKFGLKSGVKTEAKSFFSEANIQSLIKKVNNENVNEAAKELQPTLRKLLESSKDRVGGFNQSTAAKLLGLPSKASIKEIEAASKQQGFVAGRKGSGFTFARKASGGGISGSDTVPALLTPGEFVINKSSAQSIGYSNLSKMNQTGVKRFAAGGPVGIVQRFGEGGTPKPISVAGVGGPDQKIIAGVNNAYNQLAGVLKAAIPHMQKSGASAAEVAAMEKQYATVRTVQKATVQALVKEGKKDKLSESSLIAVRETLTKTLQSSDKLAKKEVARQKKASQGKLAQAMPTFAAGAGAVKKGLGRVGQAAQSMKGGAEAAQSMAFMGAAAATTAIQMSSLSDTTKQAATETIAFASGLTMAGTTVIQMLSGLANMAGLASAANQAAAASEAAETTANVAAMGSETAETVANVASAESEAAEALMNVVSTVTEGVEATADTAEAIASSAAAGPMMAIAAPLIALAVLVAAVVLALKYFSSKLRAEADALAKRRNTLLDNIGAGKGGSAETAKSDVTRELGLREDADSLGVKRVFGGKIEAGYTVDEDGKAQKSFTGTLKNVAGVLDATSIGLGTLLKATLVYAITSDEAVQAMADEAMARQAIVDGIGTSIDTFARLSESGKKFDDALQDLNTIKFADTEQGRRDKVAQQTEIAAGLDTSGLNEEYAQLQKVAVMAGESLSSLSETGLEEEFGKGSAELIAFQIATRNVNKAFENMQKKTQLAREAFNSAFDIEMADVGETGTFDDLIASGGQLAQTFELLKASMQDEAKAKIAQAQADQKAAREQIKTGEEMTSWFNTETGLSDEGQAKVDAGFAALEDAQKREAAARQRLAKQEEALEKSGKDRVDAVREQNIANREAAEAANALAEQIKATTNFMKQLSAIEFNQAQYSQNLSNQATVVSGGRMDHSVAIQGLGEDPTMIADINQFSSDMMSAIGDLPAGMQQEAKRQLATVVKTSKLFTEGKDNVLKAFPVGTTSLDKDFDPEKIIRAAGLDPDDMDKAELNDIMKKIREKAQDGISDAEFDEIFAAQREAGKAASEANAQINAVRNADLDAYRQYVSEIAQVRDRDIAASLANVDAANRVAEMRAEGRGEELSIQEKEKGRRTRASAQLAGIRDPSGKRVEAGNIEQVLATRLKAEKDLDRISQVRQQGGLSKEQRNTLIAKEERLADVVQRTTNELERLGDQSDKAADIMGEIEKERGKREVAKGILQDFVFGGKEDRGNLNFALAGVQAAAATGTVQNQSEEQRKATLGMLDRLGDIQVGPRGETAKQLKEKIIIDDAVKMGLDPKIAEKIAKATSKEEKLINALDNLGDTIIKATKAEGTHYTPDYQPPDGSDPTVTGVFPTSHMNAQAQVAQMSDVEVLNRSRQEKIAGFKQEMKDATTSDEKKDIRRRYSEFQKEQKSLRFNFLRGRGDFSKENREQTMAEYRDRLAADINEGTQVGKAIGTDRDFQTEDRIGEIRKRRSSNALYSVSDDLSDTGGAPPPTPPTPPTPPKRFTSIQEFTAYQKEKKARFREENPEMAASVDKLRESGLDSGSGSLFKPGSAMGDAAMWTGVDLSKAIEGPTTLTPEQRRSYAAASSNAFKSPEERAGGNVLERSRNYQKTPSGRATRSGVTSTTGMTGAGEAGGLAIDPTALQGVLTGFNDMFGKTLQDIINPFKEMAANLSSLSQSFENLTFTHNFTGDLSLAFNITNQAELVDIISKGITPKIASMIKEAINNQKKAGKTDTTGGASGLPPGL